MLIALKYVLIISVLVLVDITNNLIPVQAQINPNLEVATDPPQPPDRGTPDDRKPAGTRGDCEATSQPFTPLLPIAESGFTGFTITGYPTFWFYVPYKTSSVSSGKFVLEDEQGNLVYRLLFKLSETPGFVSVTLPNTEQALEPNQQYRWVFMLYCESQQSAKPDPIWYEGVVQRVDSPAVETELQTASLEQRVNLYIKHEIWYDISTDLKEIRNVPNDWEKLLKAIGLEQLEPEPIVGSVEPIQN
ncbi:MAG TPA: hypothetical protein DD379_23145 [Cyanobacteria bacterium UBA11162]|nr:hypothetical protein [Cyanobacteria bacterium UBA11162]